MKSYKRGVNESLGADRPGVLVHCSRSFRSRVFMVKACLYSNDRFVDSILSIIDLMRVNFECVK